jgi:hypothetical protein
MRRFRNCCYLLLLAVQSAGAAEPQGRIVEDIWDVAYLEGGKAGFVHTLVRAVEQNGRQLHRATMELNLSVKRFNDTISLRMETGTDETLEGKVVGVSMRQFLGKQQKLVLTGRVGEGNKLSLQVDGGQRLDQQIPWNDQVVGLYRQERLFQEHKVKPGDQFSYLSFEPQLTTVINTRVTVKDYEDVEVFKVKQKLLRVEAVSDKIQDVQMPPLTTWLDKNLVPVRSEVEMPGLGRLVLYRGTERQAKAPGGTTRVDIGWGQSIRLKQFIPNPYDAQAVVFRITLKGDENPTTAVAQDDRQQIKNVQGNTFELHIRASRGPRPTADPDKKASQEFLKSSYFINSDDPEVKALARRAVGTVTDPWSKALRIEKWVHEHVDRSHSTEAFATADEVARTLEGDCTEHAVLVAAMCRVVEIPSRTALGLLYVKAPDGQPTMGYHMWTEVWVRGQWLPLDATLGRGFVDATHLKIADHSWYKTQSLTPLLPVLRVLGKLSIEVVRVTDRD